MSIAFWIWIFLGSLLGLLSLFLVRFFVRKRRLKKSNEWKEPEESPSSENLETPEEILPPTIPEKKLSKALLADLGRAEKLIENKKYEEAARLLISILAHDENHGEANAQLALVYLQMGDFSRSEGFFRRALSVNPRDPALLTNFAIALFEQKTQGALSESLDALEKAVQVDPKNAERYANFGQSLFFAGRLQDALGAFTEAVRLSPRRLEFLFFLGDTLLALQKYSEARDTFERILRISPNNKEAHNEWEKLELRLGTKKNEE